ncbi:hypothetical protein [Pseudogemmobacter faecipullorum]|uniref:Uncharacterized protein n=1 Tax=Pseudogemmobacter faecipullorum TaxID=2755041 RepID=A0ABS8CM56_9RHOB|nr:hypothetical protein [Pseudogemmobacter faecipullorum]MCB5410468.1 hypothetical protein [Pseudogemmobacter faecipullorum]
MAERDYSTSPIADSLGLRSVIDGLAHDLQELRDRKITPADGLARAAVAKQLFNGVRLYLVARGLRAPVSPPPEANPRVIEGKAE